MRAAVFSADWRRLGNSYGCLSYGGPFAPRHSPDEEKQLLEELLASEIDICY